MNNKTTQGREMKVLYKSGCSSEYKSGYSNKKLIKREIIRILKDNSYSINKFIVCNSLYMVSVGFNDEIVKFRLPCEFYDSLFSITIYKSEVVLFINKGVSVV